MNQKQPYDKLSEHVAADMTMADTPQSAASGCTGRRVRDLVFPTIRFFLWPLTAVDASVPVGQRVLVWMLFFLLLLPFLVTDVIVLTLLPFIFFGSLLNGNPLECA
jgi:hypothetical protein